MIDILSLTLFSPTELESWSIGSFQTFTPKTDVLSEYRSLAQGAEHSQNLRHHFASTA